MYKLNSRCICAQGETEGYKYQCGYNPKRLRLVDKFFLGHSLILGDATFLCGVVAAAAATAQPCFPKRVCAQQHLYSWYVI